MTVAPRHMSGPPVSIAGEAFMRLPPIVPCARVACEPTIAEASASAVNRSRTSRLRGDLLVRDERAEPEGTVHLGDAAQLDDAIDRHDALGQRRLALASSDDEVGATGDGTRAADERLDRLVDRALRTRTRRRSFALPRSLPPRHAPASSAAPARARPWRWRSRSQPRPPSGRTAAHRSPSSRAARRSVCRSRPRRCRSAARPTR